MGGVGRGRTVRDWAVAVAAAILMSFRVAVGPAVQVSPAGEAATLALAAITGAALVWRRRWPWLAAGVAVTASALYAMIAGPVAPVAGWLAVVVVARHVPVLGTAVRGAIAAALAVIAGSVVGAVVHDAASALPLVVSLTVVVLLAAVVARLQTARVGTLRKQREFERQQAVTGERLRIARDLHDLVGHGLSTIAVQSSTARLALDAGDSATAREALAAVEGASRGALAEMRQMLGVLRQADGDLAPAAAPAPGLDRIDALVQDAQAAGHTVTVDCIGPVDAAPAAAGVTAYRVVREAITNAIRHAPGAPITITLNASDDSLTIEVTDDGAGGDAASEETVSEDAASEDGDRPSYGLLGLRERIAAAGGTLDAGLRADATGWRVAARLPIREGADA